MYEEVFAAPDKKIGLISLESKNQKQYNSYLFMVEPERLFIEHPLEKSILVPMHVDERIQILAFTDNGVIAGNSIILEKQVKPKQGLWIKKPDNIERIQRRQHVRVPMPVAVNIFVGKDRGPDKELEEILTLQTNTYNISAGGMSFLHKKELPKDAIYKIELIFPKGELTLNTEAKFIYSRAMLPDEGANLPFLNAVKFLSLEDTDREKIARYVFKFQIEMKKKGQNI